MNDEEFKIFSQHFEALMILQTARIQALRTLLTAIAAEAGVEKIRGLLTVDEFYQKCAKDDAQRRLEKLENSDPGLAAKLLEMIEGNL